MSEQTGPDRYQAAIWGPWPSSPPCEATSTRSALSRRPPGTGSTALRRSIRRSVGSPGWPASRGEAAVAARAHHDDGAIRRSSARGSDRCPPASYGRGGGWRPTPCRARRHVPGRVGAHPRTGQPRYVDRTGRPGTTRGVPPLPRTRGPDRPTDVRRREATRARRRPLARGSRRRRWASSDAAAQRKNPAARPPCADRPDPFERTEAELALYPFGPTQREAEVLRHVAAGRTNQQIADTLFITRKTASVHVSNIIGKLGAANRVQAAAVAQRLGLADDPTDR